MFAVGMTVIVDEDVDEDVLLVLELEPAVRRNPAVVTMFEDGITVKVDVDAGDRCEATTPADGITVIVDAGDVSPPDADTETRCEPPAVVEMLTAVGITVIVEDAIEEAVAKMRDGVAPGVIMFVGPVFVADGVAVVAIALTAFTAKGLFTDLDLIMLGDRPVLDLATAFVWC